VTKVKRFTDRDEAGKLLAEHLSKEVLGKDALVLALTRGGVAVAQPVSERLRVPLDLLIVRKLGAPGQPELAIGALASGGFIFLNQYLVEKLDLAPQVVEKIKSQEMVELKRREQLYFQGERHIPWQAKDVILIDDGIATGATMEVAIRAVKAAQPKTLIVAVPVAALEAVERLHRSVDHILALQTSNNLVSVSEYYELFPQITDQDVLDILAKSRKGTYVHDYS
jgi:putative phosphoribosyl transferase